MKTDACATASDIPRYVKDILVQINDEVMTRYYDCGLIAPQALEGCKVLLYPGLRNVSKKWTMPIRDWKAALNQFIILFGDRVPV